MVLLLKTTIFYPFFPPNSLQDVEPWSQNLLCDNTSPLDIVTRHVSGDRAYVSESQEARVISYVSHVATRYILVLDRSDNMNKHARWSNLHNALFG